MFGKYPKYRIKGSMNIKGDPCFIIQVKEEGGMFGGWNQYYFDGTKYWQYKTFESALKDLVVLSTTATVKDKGKKPWVVVNQQQDNSGKQEEIIIESEKE